jgi:Fur family ferric uptake transcriptional regulator
METRIERLCVEQGLKMTGQRRVIARVLSEAEDHPDVEELYAISVAAVRGMSPANMGATII